MEVLTVVRNLGELGINLQKILARLMANQELMKLLYYTDKDPLNHEDLSQDIIKNEIYEKLLKIIPRVGPKETAQSVIALRVVNGYSNPNIEFTNLTIGIEVFVPLTQWFIKDSNLRPFAIMSEIDKSLKGKKIDGLGTIDGGSFQINFLTDEISCYEMEFSITIYD